MGEAKEAGPPRLGNGEMQAEDGDNRQPAETPREKRIAVIDLAPHGGLSEHGG